MDCLLYQLILSVSVNKKSLKVLANIFFIKGLFIDNLGFRS